MSEYLGKIVYLTQSQYNTMMAASPKQITVNGTTHTYDASNIYITDTPGNASTIGANNYTVDISVPANALFTDHYHTSGSWSGLTYTAQSVNGAGTLAFTLPSAYPKIEVGALSKGSNIKGYIPIMNVTNDEGVFTWQDSLYVYDTTSGSSSNVPTNVYLNVGKGVVSGAAAVQGIITLHSATNNYYGNLKPATLTSSNKEWTLPNATGTIALAATTLSGYGITDAKIASGVITLGSNTITPVTSVNGHSGASVSVTASDLGLSSALRYQGTTTTTMSDGLTTANVTINGETFTPTSGDVVFYSDKEYVWTGSAWEELGGESSFKKVQTAVSTSTASGSSATTFVSSVTQDTEGVITVSTSTLDTSGTWSGTSTKSTTTADTTNALYPVGVTSSATTTLKRDTSITMTGGKITAYNILINSGSDNTITKRCNEVTEGATSPGWTRTLIRAIGKEDQLISQIGVNGTGETTSYTYIGSGSYNSTINLRIYASGAIYIPHTQASSSTTSGALQVVGGVGIGKELYVGSGVYTSLVSATHVLDQTDGFRVLYNTTVDFRWCVGTGNTNHGMYDAKAGDWIILAGTNNVWTFKGTALNATNISATLATTSKAYLLGTTTAVTSTAANVGVVGDTGVYLTTTAGQLSAKSYSVNDGTNEKVRLQWNSTDSALDFIFN